MLGTIVVHEYDPHWTERFQELREKLWSAVSDVALSIEHIGSTSVPGLAAKPIVDLDIVVPSAAELSEVIARLATLGYVHRGNLGVEGREAFENPPGEQDHHLYLCPEGSIGLRNHLAVREFLRADDEAARAYGELKKSLAETHPNDIDGYIAGKSYFILRILSECGMSTDDLQSVALANQVPES